ncbi:substrate-binding domain-containing protein [Frankia sp. CNm7]|uniref:Substrate-binding domain-containing protein n=1 Tax=Frankia nepalensis TaxID=1836974 RepID=A0A937RBP0_9ACTN|nr:substrate-binding domain-containing protein [Frankia nepalensis]MBL7499704.1 substrate-binding domain-containing protein [Frankia nepalensis]MBL7515004.1 substrate-binding domain-containing protein [Frankia nepalensis]MBL7521310.1 substrate-binding domain-containing protein [Frankia nepalensis]MBL7629136.1 substrate-binding domain-containing protein [Frankia nepalensis]
MAQVSGMMLGRRRFLVGGAALGAAGVAALTGCTSNDDDTAENANVSTGGGDNAAPGKQITIGFSAPAADHGWIGAITTNARAQADVHSDVDLQATEGTNDLSLQISQVETLINDGVDVLVILPHDGKALTEVARKAMDAGIPVINLDRVFDSPLAYRTWIGGDNYGMGVAAGNYIAARLKDNGVTNPVIAEIPGIDSLPLTQERSKGFSDALAAAGLKVGPRVPAEFTVETGERAAANLLQAAPRIDALWNHDDDQGIGVLSAIDAAGRDEFFMVGGAGSKDVMELIKADDGVVKATVTYPPSMASSAINLARLVAQGRTLSDLVENDVPSSITLASATITKDNVDKYLKFGFAS